MFDDNEYYKERDKVERVLSIISLVSLIVAFLASIVAFIPYINFVYVFYFPFIFSVASLIMSVVINQRRGKYRKPLLIVSGIMTFVGVAYIVICIFMLKLGISL